MLISKAIEKGNEGHTIQQTLSCQYAQGRAECVEKMKELQKLYMDLETIIQKLDFGKWKVSA